MTTTNPSDIAQVAQEWVETTARLDKDKRRVEELADYLRAHLAIGGQVVTPDGLHVGHVAGAARFDVDKARDLLTPAQLDLITPEPVPVPSKELAKRYLPGALVDALHTRTRPSVRVLK